MQDATREWILPNLSRFDSNEKDCGFGRYRDLTRNPLLLLPLLLKLKQQLILVVLRDLFNFNGIKSKKLGGKEKKDFSSRRKPFMILSV